MKKRKVKLSEKCLAFTSYIFGAMLGLWVTAFIVFPEKIIDSEEDKRFLKPPVQNSFALVVLGYGTAETLMGCTFLFCVKKLINALENQDTKT